MPLPYSIAAFLASSVIALSTLYQVYLWQRKEYRIDRLRAEIIQPETLTTSNWVWIVSFFTVTTILLLRQIGLPSSANNLNIIAYVGLIAQLGSQIQRGYARGIYRPYFTSKAYLVLTLLIFAAVGLMAIFINDQTLIPFQLFVSTTLLPVMGVLAIMIANIITYPGKYRIIMRAKTIRRAYTGKVITVTGSVGKTSTKEFLHQIIKASGKKVTATKEHRNSELTVAQDVIEQLPKKPSIYIAEAGAYRRGEIRAIANIVQPSVAIITAIHNQHAALFGSLENVAKTKWELVESLSSDGIAVLNYDDPVIRKRSRKYTGSVITYATTDTNADIHAKAVTYLPDRIAFKLVIHNHQQLVAVPLIGRGSLSSVLAAVAGATAIGILPEKIFSALGQLSPLPRTMQLKQTKTGAAVIDDSYSASELSVQNVLDQLEVMPHKDKRIIFVPIIELGKEAATVHKRLGEMLAKSKAKVYIFGVRNKKDIIKGAKQKANQFIWIENPSQLASQVLRDSNQNTVIAIAGRIPESTHQEIVT